MQLPRAAAAATPAQDLLRPGEAEQLQIRENEGGVFVAGVREVAVHSCEDCLDLLHMGDRNRRAAAGLCTLLAYPPVPCKAWLLRAAPSSKAHLNTPALCDVRAPSETALR